MLPLVWARFGQWDKILSLNPSDFSYEADGVMLPRGAVPFNLAVYHYTRALALAHQAADAGLTPKQQAEEINRSVIQSLYIICL